MATAAGSVPHRVAGASTEASDARPSTSSTARDVGSDQCADGTHHGAVDVKAGEEEFNKLSRRLSHHSELHRVRTRKTDLEKGNNSANDEEESFDLAEYLSRGDQLAKQQGIKNKHVGVTFRDVEVVGTSGIDLNIRTFWDGLLGVFLAPIFTLIQVLGIKAPEPRKILQGFSGFAKPGEMVLVLGRPGSGCSTFLKVMANQRAGFVAVNGDVSYAGIPASQLPKRYRGEFTYMSEDDLFHPTLTVAQTLDFALSMKTPGKMLDGVTKKSFKTEVRNTLLRMLNMPHTANTLVGDAQVRGVSGGERKRVSIAEMMTTRGAVVAYDQSTRGLDASTSTDLAKSLRIIANTFKTVLFSSLYQAGEASYEQFDKVMLIDNGRMVYFGPREAARQYFVDLGFADLPAQTSADYLSGCTDTNERRFQEGRGPHNVPSTPEALEQAYRESETFKRMIAQQTAYEEHLKQEKSYADEFDQAVKEDKNKGVSQKSVYTVSTFVQILYLTKRQLQITLGDKVDIAVSFITALGIAIIVGTCFLNLPETAAGAFSRGGVLFLGLLFNALTAFSELPTQMGGRPILYKQQGFGFFRAGSMAMASMFADIPFSFIRILLFDIILYFLAGLRLDAGAFFTFFLATYVSFLALSALFRMFGVICTNFDGAARLASLIISALVLYGGYIIPRAAMKRWLFWISYLDPVYYGFSAVMLNEFDGLSLDCVESYITPRNPPGSTRYPTTLGPNQVCTLQGSTAGQQAVDGLEYLRASFGYEKKDLWLNIGILFIFWVGLQLITVFAIEITQKGMFSSSLTITKKPNQEERRLNEELRLRKEARDRGEASEPTVHVDKEGQRPFTWEALSYTVPVAGGEKQLLDNVYGYVKPGTLTALMGASGAGKTTLLDVLADRKTSGTVEGQRLVNGVPIDREFQRQCSYALQADIHEPTATVREALRFSAYLRQPFDVPKEEKDKFVEEIIEVLELTPIADSMIGYPEFGLGVAQRKSVTVGIEIAARPQLLLILDEPTSGLDGQSAYNLVLFLKRLAAAGQTILCTIHQPNALLFEQFDRLLLLERGGKTVYFGDVGKDSEHLKNYFKSNGAECPSNINPAEFMLDAVGAGSQKRIGTRDWADIYLDSELHQENLRVIEELKGGFKEATSGDRPAIKEFATPFVYQLKVVTTRALTAAWRSPDYTITRLFQHLSIGLFTGLTFLQVSNNVAGMQYRVFAVFIVTVMPAIILSSIEPMYIMARNTFYREESSKYYTGPVFALSQMIAELPNSILCAVVFFLVFAFPIGFSSGVPNPSNRDGYLFAMILITELFSVSLGQAVAAFSPSIYVAGCMNPPLVIIMSLFCGVTIVKEQIPKFYRVWLYELNPFTRLVASLVSNAVSGLPVRCDPNEFSVFTPPSGQTCQQWAGDFVSAYGGYLLDPDARDSCNYCQFSVGDEFLRGLSVSFSTRGRDIGILIAFTVFNTVLVLFASKFLRWSKN